MTKLENLTFDLSALEEEFLVKSQRQNRLNRYLAIALFMGILAGVITYSIDIQKKNIDIEKKNKKLADTNFALDSTNDELNESNKNLTIQFEKTSQARDSLKNSYEVIIRKNDSLISGLESLKKANDEISIKNDSIKQQSDSIKQQSDSIIVANIRINQEATVKYLYSAQALANNSHLIEDKYLRGMVAQQAFLFNDKYREDIYQKVWGKEYDPVIYLALYESLKRFEGDKFNLISGHKEEVRKILVNQEKIYMAGGDGIITKGPEYSLKEHHIIFKRDFSIRCLDLSANGSLLIAGESPFLYSQDLTTNSVDSLHINQGAVISMVSDKINLIVLTSGKDSTIKCIDYANKKTLWALPLPTQVVSLALDSYGGSLYGAGLNGILYRWEISSFQNRPSIAQEVFKQNGFGITAVTLNAKSSLLAFGDENGFVRIIDRSLSDSENLKLYKLRSNNSRINELVFDENTSKLVACSSDGVVNMWIVNHQISPPFEEPPVTFKDNNRWVVSIAFDSEGNHLFGGSQGGLIRKWTTNPTEMAEHLHQFVSRENAKPLDTLQWEKYAGKNIPIENTKKESNERFKNGSTQIVERYKNE